MIIRTGVSYWGVTSGELSSPVPPPPTNQGNHSPVSKRNPLFVAGKSPHTLWISNFDVGRWAAQGHSDFLEAGVKGQLPSVADPAEVIGGQQVNLGRLHGLLHPLQNLQQGNVKNAGITDRFCCRKLPVGFRGTQITSWIRFISLGKNNNVKGSQVINL